MKPTTTSTDLEKLVARIHKLVEPEGTTVKWNDKIRDPDTGRLRQIDGTIERDGKNIHIECRDHAQPQDVKWVEELIGRRISLQANGIIGVSISGFTKPAVEKAAAFGVILRTLAEMTDAEIQAWGKTASVITNYIEISFLEITVFVDARQIGLVSHQPRLLISGTAISPVFIMLQEMVQKADGKFFMDRNTTVTGSIVLPNLMVDGASAIKSDIRLRGRLRQEKVEVVGVWNYKGFDQKSSGEAVVSKHGTGKTEIIQRGDIASMLLDFSSVVHPNNCFLNTLQVDFGRIVKADISPLALPHSINFTIDTILDVKAIVHPEGNLRASSSTDQPLR
ncbi:MAG: restriction endonuclease [Alphaproteobacteria bacterium]|nr:restriction endonuclease [Alphaproteobacteria bacterium]